MKTNSDNNVQISAWKNFFLFCAGADSSTLAKATSSEVNRYVTLGMCVLIPTILGLFTGTYAALFISDNLWGAVAAGVVYAIVIFLLDRAIAAASSKSWLPMIGRFALAITIGLVMSFPAKLKVFEDTINEELYTEQVSAKSVIDANYDEMRGAIRADLDAREAEVTRLRNEWACEMDGTCGSMKPGRSTISDAKEELYLLAKHEFDAYKAQKDAEQAEIGNDQLTEFTEMKGAQATGLLGRVEALGRVADRSKWVEVVAWVLIAFFILIELIPMLVKLSLTGNLYEEIVQAENEAKLVATKQTFQLKAEVEVFDKSLPLHKQLNESKLAIATVHAQTETARAEMYIREVIRLANIEAEGNEQIRNLDGLPEEKKEALITMIQLLTDHYGDKICEMPTLKDQLYDILNF